MTDPTQALLKRLAACLFGGFLLALMVGNQQGTLTDFGVSFRTAVAVHRIWIFLLIGVAIFLVITFWPSVRPYLTKPGAVPIAVGGLTVLAALTVMNWWDPVQN